MTRPIRLAWLALFISMFVQPAAAQNYDGEGLLRFGVFMQGYTMPSQQTAPLSASGDLGGYGVGASFGYDWMLRGGWVIGAEADGVATDSGKRIANSKYNVDYMATFRGRLGYWIHPHVLLYGTGGFAFNGLTYRGDLSTPGPYDKVSGHPIGWTAGTGLEWRYYNTIFFGEYLYTDFDTFSFTGGLGVNTRLETESHNFRLGIKWIYGHDHYLDEVKFPY